MFENRDGNLLDLHERKAYMKRTDKCYVAISTEPDVIRHKDKNYVCLECSDKCCLKGNCWDEMRKICHDMKAGKYWQGIYWNETSDREFIQQAVQSALSAFYATQAKLAPSMSDDFRMSVARIVIGHKEGKVYQALKEETL